MQNKSDARQNFRNITDFEEELARAPPPWTQRQDGRSTMSSFFLLIILLLSSNIKSNQIVSKNMANLTRPG